jgi:hypothetical protein
VIEGEGDTQSEILISSGREKPTDRETERQRDSDRQLRGIETRNQ